MFLRSVQSSLIFTHLLVASTGGMTVTSVPGLYLVRTPASVLGSMRTGTSVVATTHQLSPPNSSGGLTAEAGLCGCRGRLPWRRSICMRMGIFSLSCASSCISGLILETASLHICGSKSLCVRARMRALVGPVPASSTAVLPVGACAAAFAFLIRRSNTQSTWSALAAIISGVRPPASGLFTPIPRSVNLFRLSRSSCMAAAQTGSSGSFWKGMPLGRIRGP
mmetsp:Transcript_66800/g.150852  ORF Transcript_66800/g.150852 Transcript_66800/m.150852 type:complete len:222 (-) Transcript_66800:690-1355(-)